MCSNGNDDHYEKESSSRSLAEVADDEVKPEEDFDHVQVEHVPKLLEREGSARRLDSLDDDECTREVKASLRNRPEDLRRLKEMGKRFQWRQALEVFRRAKKDGTFVMDNGIYR